MEVPLDTVSCLSNAPQRLRLLRSLEGTQKSFGELKRELDSPRTTLKRNLSTLEERDWVTEARSGYRTTTTGCLILREFQLLGQKVERIRTLEPFLAAIDAPADVDTGRLRDARVTVPEPDEPYRPSNRLLEALDAVRHSRAFTPVLSARVLDWLGEATVGIECVVSAEALDHLPERDGDDALASVDGGVETLLRFEGTLPYGLFLADEHVAFVAYDDVDRIEALVESEAEEAIEWGEGVYESYRQGATSVVEREVTA